jgi:hypothetical protein
MRLVEHVDRHHSKPRDLPSDHQTGSPVSRWATCDSTRTRVRVGPGLRSSYRAAPTGRGRRVRRVVGRDGRLVGQVDPATPANDQHGALARNASLSPADSAIRPPRWQVLRGIENPAETNRAAARP